MRLIYSIAQNEDIASERWGVALHCPHLQVPVADIVCADGIKASLYDRHWQFCDENAVWF